jgi:hypothetical protein
VCEHQGRELVVAGMTDRRIPWPFARRSGRRTPIVCGELVRAIRQEAAVATGYRWGVCSDLTMKWRRSLGAQEQTNEGSKRLRALIGYRGRQEHLRRAQEAAARRASVTARRVAKAIDKQQAGPRR